MASRNGQANGRGNGHRARAFDTQAAFDRALRVTEAAGEIVRLSDQVAHGATSQVRSLDDALTGLNQMSASLGETAGQAETIATATDQLVSAVTEVSASIDQVTAN